MRKSGTKDVPYYEKMRMGTGIVRGELPWGQWYVGDRYDVRLAHTGDYSDTRSRWIALIWDKFLNGNYYRLAVGVYVSNNSPMYITLDGRKRELSELLREKCPDKLQFAGN